VAPLPTRVSRVPALIAGFKRYLDAYTRRPAFTRAGQLEYHLETIGLRRQLGSAVAAISHESFIGSLYRTLQAWGIGARASNLVPEREFAARLQAKKEDFAALETSMIDDPALNPTRIGEHLWRIIESLEIVNNNAKIVPGSKTLHHILPELVVPIDRAWTQKFFRWHNPEFQYGQAACFAHAFSAFVEIARKVNPQQYVGAGWNSSRTKAIDNALIGMLSEEMSLAS
jgi:hypothetical protein